MVTLLTNVKMNIILTDNIILITTVKLVLLEQDIVQVTQLLLNVYQDTVYLQVVLVKNVKSEQVHVLFQELQLLEQQQLVLHHSKM
jgi:hypothetical protein